MANNTVIGKNVGIAKSNTSFASAGVTETNTKIITAFNPLRSFNPARTINSLTAITANLGLLLDLKVASDFTAWLGTTAADFGGSGGGTITPPAPTNGIVNDTNNTFDWTNATGYTTSDHETTIDAGTTWVSAVKPLFVGPGDSAANTIGVRVKAATGRNASTALYNAMPFTSSGGGTVTPPAPTSPTINDSTNFFDWTNATGYTTADHETTLNAGATWQAAEKPLFFGAGAYEPNQIGVRVKAATGRNASTPLYYPSATVAGTGGGGSNPAFSALYTGADNTALTAYTPEFGTSAGTGTLDGAGHAELLTGQSASTQSVPASVDIELTLVDWIPTSVFIYKLGNGGVDYTYLLIANNGTDITFALHQVLGETDTQIATSSVPIATASNKIALFQVNNGVASANIGGEIITGATAVTGAGIVQVVSLGGTLLIDKLYVNAL